MSKWIYKSVPAFSNYFNVEWTMSLLGFMIFIGCQPGMGWQMYAWKKEGSFYYPASIYPSRQFSCIHESANNIFSITTRPIQSTTVIHYDDAEYSDASMFLKSQDPTENDMGNDADTIRWHSFVLRPRSSAAMLTTSRPKMNKSQCGTFGSRSFLVLTPFAARPARPSCSGL